MAPSAESELIPAHVYSRAFHSFHETSQSKPQTPTTSSFPRCRVSGSQFRTPRKVGGKLGNLSPEATAEAHRYLGDQSARSLQHGDPDASPRVKGPCVRPPEHRGGVAPQTRVSFPDVFSHPVRSRMRPLPEVACADAEATLSPCSPQGIRPQGRGQGPAHIFPSRLDRFPAEACRKFSPDVWKEGRGPAAPPPRTSPSDVPGPLHPRRPHISGHSVFIVIESGTSQRE
ncbi:hypothetical protein mRhiFer1_009100 [Rhinolophus ferrumequinum]|uniref:Uncharacterized protein n=1 Tax=Rhinolophus ferrumequinum TaxID=59479 RepID=A0A7J7SXY8_RHIFE|nr:hypothetical protein mRhiFer1_009100 [Rhinolophus ferrumequinum]